MALDDEVSLIPDLYYDILSRIIPGIIFVAAYNFDDFKGSLNIQLIALGLILSYLIGFVFYIVTAFLWHHLFYRFKRLVSFFFRKIEYIYISEVWRVIRFEVPAVYVKPVIKVVAELSMFRTFTIIPILFFIYRPKVLSSFSQFVYVLLLLVSFAIFSLCMLNRHKALCAQIRQMQRSRQVA